MDLREAGSGLRGRWDNCCGAELGAHCLAVGTGRLL